MATSAAISCSPTTWISTSTIQPSASGRRSDATMRVRFNLGRTVGAGSTKLTEGDSHIIGRESSLAGSYDAAIRNGGARSTKLRPLVPRAALKQEEADQASVQVSSPLKDFLEDLKSVGRVRLIVNTSVAVLESVTSLDKLYYHQSARGEYANVMSRDDNVDFHLLLEKVAAARLVKGKSMKGDIPTYTVRIVDVNNDVAVSIFVMWKLGTSGEYDPGQVDAFQALLEKYGDEVKFRS